MRKATKITAIIALASALAALVIELIAFVLQKPIIKIFGNFDTDNITVIWITGIFSILLTVGLTIAVFWTTMKKSPSSAMKICLVTVILLLTTPILFSFLNAFENSAYSEANSVSAVAARSIFLNYLNVFTSPFLRLNQTAVCILLGLQIADSHNS